MTCRGVWEWDDKRWDTGCPKAAIDSPLTIDNGQLEKCRPGAGQNPANTENKVVSAIRKRYHV